MATNRAGESPDARNGSSARQFCSRTRLCSVSREGMFAARPDGTGPDSTSKRLFFFKCPNRASACRCHRRGRTVGGASGTGAPRRTGRCRRTEPDDRTDRRTRRGTTRSVATRGAVRADGTGRGRAARGGGRRGPRPVSCRASASRRAGGSPVTASGRVERRPTPTAPRRVRHPPPCPAAVGRPSPRRAPARRCPRLSRPAVHRPRKLASCDGRTAHVSRCEFVRRRSAVALPGGPGAPNHVCTSFTVNRLPPICGNAILPTMHRGR